MRTPAPSTASLATALALVLAAVPAQARPVYMKIGDIKGETRAASGDHDEWIELTSLRFAPEPRAAGGVRVAAGDVNGDGYSDPDSDADGVADAAATAGAGTGPGTGRPAAAATDVAAPEPGPAALLLPAVQKVREAAARMKLARCKSGRRLAPIAVRDSDTGRTGRILDPVLTGCAGEQVSFNFTKIEWE